ncbi:MAG: hypothetical protein K2N05_09140 [Muribaculaceae bacterium]|nr:hypothetical protein [Muribaculaceae bacterium]
MLPTSFQVRASLLSATQVPLRIATASAVGSIDCVLRLHYALRRHPSFVGGGLAPFRLWLQTIFEGCTCSAVNPTPPLAILSPRCYESAKAMTDP